MDKRTLLIIIALVLPLATLGVLAQSEPAPDKKGKPAASASLAPKEKNARPAHWRKGPPATVEEARERARARLAQLEKMTQAEWEAEQAAKRRAFRRPPRPAQQGLPPLDPNGKEIAPAAGQVPPASEVLPPANQ